ncbi:hypothetical protein FRC05_011018 [Tulasnella sp. 425]|nr:hypothetical protein FRC05_011018 [Tulasnella sp. 425]
MALSDFLRETSLPACAYDMDSLELPTAPAARAEDGLRARDYEGRGGYNDYPLRGTQSGGSYTAESRYPPREELPLPTKPPYTAFVGNLAFDISERDVEDFFKVPLKSIKIIKDREGRAKGYGYVEFETLQGLKDGLAKTGAHLSGRTVRVSVAEPQKERERGGGFDDDKISSPWRREGPLPPPDRPPRGAGSRFSDAPSANRASRYLPAGEAESNSDWRSTAHPRGPLPPTDRPSSGPRKTSGFSSHEGPAHAADMEETCARGKSSFFGRDGVNRAADDEPSDWRSGPRRGPPPPNGRSDRSPSESVPTTPNIGRRKLELFPRTSSQSTATSPVGSPKAATPNGGSRSNPFGAAKPVDVAAREKEIEEKLHCERGSKPKERRTDDSDRPPHTNERSRFFNRGGGPERDGGWRMLATIDGTESLPREATLSHSLVSQTTEPDTSERRASNDSLFIHRLPTEIFLHFITLVLAGHRPHYNPGEVYTYIARLKLVCVLWADRINSYPGFWDVLTNRLGPGHVSAVLKRSRTVPLCVEIAATRDQDIQAYITAIKSCAHRWNTLNIRWVGINEAVLREVLQVPAPQLQKLSIAGSSNTPLTAIHLFGGQAPLLHTVKIAPNEWNIIRPIIPRLKHLVVDETRFRGGPTSHLTFDIIMKALTESPEIEVLTFFLLKSQFAASAEAFTIPSRPILLSRLRSITFPQTYSAIAFRFLTAISFPSDCEIKMHMLVTRRPGSLNPFFSILSARLSQVAPLDIDIRYTAWNILITISYKRNGVGRMEITLYCSDMGLTSIKGFIEEVLSQLGEAIRVSSISVHLRMGWPPLDSTVFPRETIESYNSVVETVDGLLPSTTRASIFGPSYTDFIDHAKSGFIHLSELIIEEKSIVAPWEQLVELAKSRSGQAADPGSRVAALKSITLPSKGLDEAAREELSRVVGQVNWTNDPNGTRFTLWA